MQTEPPTSTDTRTGPALSSNGDATESSAVELTIVMPCLNEAETLETCILKAQRYLQESKVSGEILIGDNGSTDGSQEIAKRCGARVVDVPVRGYGAALDHATRHARGRYVIMADSDDSYDFLGLQPFVDQLRAGYDLVMGNRFLGGIKPGAMPWKNRYLGNPVLTMIGRLFFKCPAKDFHCGLRGFSVDAYRKMDLQTTGMEFASEMVIKATLLGMKIIEVPTTLSPDGRSRPPHLKPWRDGWRHLRFMLLFSPRWLFLFPGLGAVLIGLLCIAVLVRGPVYVGRVGFDIHTLLCAAAMVLVGVQAVCFAVFTKIFAIGEGLLPDDPKFSRLFQYVTLESGLAGGIILIAAGLAGTLFAIWNWQRTSFGTLNPPDSMRIVIPGVTSIVLGFQILLSSFFLSVLGMRVKARISPGQTETMRSLFAPKGHSVPHSSL